jgi:hypothetical protein
MSKLIGRLLVLLAFAWTSSVSAIPMLTQNGSLLTGVEVNGILYDVTFSDGIVGELYPPGLFTGEYKSLVSPLSDAVVSALNVLGTLPSGINGCTNVLSCTLFNPFDTFLPTGAGERQYVGDVYNYQNSHWQRDTFAVMQIPASDDLSTYPTITALRFSPSVVVPTPATLTLLAFGLAAIGFSRKLKLHS